MWGKAEEEILQKAWLGLIVWETFTSPQNLPWIKSVVIMEWWFAWCASRGNRPRYWRPTASGRDGERREEEGRNCKMAIASGLNFPALNCVSTCRLLHVEHKCFQQFNDRSCFVPLLFLPAPCVTAWIFPNCIGVHSEAYFFRFCDYVVCFRFPSPSR